MGAITDTTIDIYKKITNPHAFDKINAFITKPYQLNQEGVDFVIRSNEMLPEVYFKHLLFPVSKFWGHYFEEKLSLLEPNDRDVMLDVCCGTGTLCLNIMPKIGFNRCIAIDNSESAISVLNNRKSADQRIEALKQEITNMEFGNNSIDAVYGNSFLHHLPDNQAFLMETYRVLKPGGVMVFTGEPTISAGFLENVIMNGVVRAAILLGLKKIKSKQKGIPITDVWLYEKQSLQDMLAAIGFVDISIKGFGVLLPLLNGPTSFVLRKLTGKSLPPNWYWKYLTWLDNIAFKTLPDNWKSHFVIAARKP
jgi:ubiquinone/menaquinone biosynthesis C-methylase UbiE